MRLESKYLSYFFLVTSILEPSIIIWNIIRVKTDHEYDILETTIIVAGVFAIVIRISTIISFITVMINFGQGLREKRMNFNFNFNSSLNI